MLKTLKAIKNSSLDRYGCVDADKRAAMLKRRYIEISRRVQNSGNRVDKLVKFHGVYTWAFGSPCYIEITPFGVIRLISYSTDVAEFYPTANGGAIIKNGWYSMTTSRHIAAFCDVFGYGAKNPAPVDLAPNAATGYALDNLSVVGLDGLLRRIENAKGVYKYQREQMAQLLAKIFNDTYYNHPEWALDDSVLKIVKKIGGDMDLSNKLIYAGHRLESWTFVNNSRNIGKSWDKLKAIVNGYYSTLEKIAA